MPKEKNSKQCSQVYHFAARWSTEHDDEKRLLLQKWLRKRADKWIFQAELTVNGEKRNPHYQIYFHTREKYRPSQLFKQVNESELRGMEIQASSTAGKEALQSYCMKEDRVAGPWADKRIYCGQDIWPEHKFPAWQKKMLEKLREPPDFRTMHWVCDPKGNNGKTSFLKFLCWKENAVGLAYAHSADALNLVSKMPDRPIYAWNLTRSKPAQLSELDLYSAMESVKDGYFINTKYETKMVLMCRPHVVVFANHLPKFAQMSADRWKIWKIINGDLVEDPHEPTIGQLDPSEPNAL